MWFIPFVHLKADLNTPYKFIEMYSKLDFDAPPEQAQAVNRLLI